jgi:hypothetical protein
MQPQPIEYTQPVQYTQPGQSPTPSQYAQPATQYAQPQHTQQPVQFVQPAQPMMQPGTQQIVYVTQEKGSNNALPWIGVVLILVSLFLPYISFLGESMSGFEMMGEVSNFLDGMDGSDGGGDDGGDGVGDDVDIPMEFMFFGIAAMMVGFGPFIFILSAVISAITLLSGKSPKAMGVLHLSYGVIFLIVAFIGTIDAGILGSWSMYDLTGFGFYIGAFASGLLFIK